jgi:ABC-2 type transport system ATP-binding protein
VSSDDGQLELIALRRHFGNTVALDRLTFTVPRGQVLGFLGPNGAGTIDGRAILRTGSRLEAGEELGSTA